MDNTPFAPFPGHDPSAWQSRLRQSVRLYLALGGEPINAQELETLLRSTEQELVDYLLQGAPPTAEALAQARSLLDLAQHQLLGSETDMRQLLDELPEVPPAPDPA